MSLYISNLLILDGEQLFGFLGDAHGGLDDLLDQLKVSDDLLDALVLLRYLGNLLLLLHKQVIKLLVEHLLDAEYSILKWRKTLHVG